MDIGIFVLVTFVIKSKMLMFIKNRIKKHR